MQLNTKNYTTAYSLQYLFDNVCKLTSQNIVIIQVQDPMFFVSNNCHKVWGATNIQRESYTIYGNFYVSFSSLGA